MEDGSPPDQTDPQAAGKHFTEANFGLTLRDGNP